MDWWGWLLIILVLVLLLWWWLRRRPEEKGSLATEARAKQESPARAAEMQVEAPVEVAESPASTATPDDLTRIEGIGPKISSVLRTAGVTTFAQLAATDNSRLKQILEDADPRLLRLADPNTWPEQAGLAAADEWDALETLQSELKGGRRE